MYGGRIFSCLLLAAAFTQCAKAQQITVATASDLQFALNDIATRFEKATGKKVNLIFGSSGNFFAQIQNGAPIDVFFSADVDYPKRLEAAGLTEPGTLHEYATGKIVMWVKKDSPLDLARGLQVLLDPAITKIAIANPAHAPYGRAAVAAMRHAGLYDKVSGKFVLGENVSQTASFVASGNADIGIVALSLALASSMAEKGRYKEIPTDAYPAIQQGDVILKAAKDKKTAQAFVEFIRTPEVLEVLRHYGFSASQKQQ
jgi:molybdate transport system substrate-binding protein